MKEPFDCEGIAGAQQSLRQSRRKMQETRAAAHRRKKKKVYASPVWSLLVMQEVILVSYMCHSRD